MEYAFQKFHQHFQEFASKLLLPHLRLISWRTELKLSGNRVSFRYAK